MTSSAIRIGVIGGILSLALNTLQAEEPSAKARTNELVGTWRLVSASYGGRESDLPKRVTMLKQITPTHFLWTRIDSTTGQIRDAAGGTYSLNGETYTETPKFGMGGDFEIVRDKPHSFTWKIDANEWHHTGKLANGLTIDEVWERVEGEN